MILPACILVAWSSVKTKLADYVSLFVLLALILIAAFSVTDIIPFYVFFESVLLPMFLIVGIWGGRERKILASYKLIIYTIGGSILMLLSILQIYYSNGTCELYIILCTKFSNLRTENFLVLFFLSIFGKSTTCSFSFVVT
jgi:NADH:ubiquinone oxidoreductase subunit 4 (subunit M)